jgi:hypothetical protein
MILHLLLGTIAATTSAPAVMIVPPQARPAVARRVAGQPCRTEFGPGSLVQRMRICHSAAEWRALDARRIARRRQGL